MRTDLFYTKKDVMNIMKVAPSTAYRVIKELNEELQAKGYFVKSGRVSVAYFNEKYYVC